MKLHTFIEDGDYWGNPIFVCQGCGASSFDQKCSIHNLETFYVVSKNCELAYKQIEIFEIGRKFLPRKKPSNE